MGIRPSLEAVYSRTEEKGRALAGEYGCSRVYTDMDAFLGTDEINTVYIATPNLLHYEQAKKALLAGKHVILEKPFCTRALQAEELIRLAKETLPGKVEHYGRIMGLRPTGLTITGARKRFGSCSAKNRICFSWRLMQYPEEAVDYVVVHELAHIRHKDHSRNFYACVEEVLPDWRERRQLLRE